MTVEQGAERFVDPGRALVTGASSGIGAAIVDRLLESGWSVLAASRTPPSRTHPRLEWRATDLSVTADIAGLAAAAGTVDAIVYAAGIQSSAVLGALDATAGEAMWRVHVEGPTALLNALVGSISDGGRVVLIGSRTSTGVAGKSQYAATKAALVALSRSWAMELAPRGITVNVVAPGPTDTPMLADPARSSTPPRVPALGRLVRPDEVAGLTAFLLGRDGGSITGQQLVICGGASL
jgi:NAD(P)-dependent dehydrogenase (short-subunit alcohol dehydrogenase family)